MALFLMLSSSSDFSEYFFCDQSYCFVHLSSAKNSKDKTSCWLQCNSVFLFLALQHRVAWSRLEIHYVFFGLAIQVYLCLLSSHDIPCRNCCNKSSCFLSSLRIHQKRFPLLFSYSLLFYDYNAKVS